MDKALRLGNDVELIVLPAIGHFDLIAPWSSAWPLVEATVMKMVGLAPSSTAPANRRLQPTAADAIVSRG